MSKKIICLGIESSCDETSAAIVDSDHNILSHIIYSQIPEHQKYGGVVPELAARSHILSIDDVIKKAIDEANINLSDLDVIAATAGPGLIGGVLIGWMCGLGISQSLNKPLVAVNHLEGHALVPRLIGTKANDENINSRLEFPYLLMLASGGHTMILKVKDVGNYELIGQTLDDSAGEAFDKVGKMLGLSYPGGPEVDKRANKGQNIFNFPKPLCDKSSCDFSFSGIKTSVRTLLSNIKQPYKEDFINNVCSSFQETVVDCIVNRLTHALEKVKDVKYLVLAGGVAKNSAIRDNVQNLAEKYNLEFIAPPLNLCTDNGAMIAWAGIENFLKGNIIKEPFQPRPRWPLTEL